MVPQPTTPHTEGEPLTQPKTGTVGKRDPYAKGEFEVSEIDSYGGPVSRELLEVCTQYHFQLLDSEKDYPSGKKRFTISNIINKGSCTPVVSRS
jgi:hypothetical protein